ncbi:MAG: hypothetical protein DWQ37_21905 [Planctomycetota bacterium]|nr:MAG: hypothetical protein DWQ37_21905 [Planctomycetota bacterium]
MTRRLFLRGIPSQGFRRKRGDDSKKPSVARRILRVAGWIPELLIDPLHITEGVVAATKWIVRMCSSPRQRQRQE